MAYPPFSPSGVTQNIAATTTASAATALVTSNTWGGSNGQIRVVHAGATNPVFVAFGVAGMAAPTAANAMPVMPGVERVFSLGQEQTHVRVIMGTGTATIYFTPGNG